MCYSGQCKNEWVSGDCKLPVGSNCVNYEDEQQNYISNNDKNIEELQNILNREEI